jgi:hypothetical protein
MSYESCALDGVFVVRWGKVPQLPDVDRYASEIAAARAKQGKPLVGLFIMPPYSAAPDEAFRKAQAKKLPEIMSNLSYAVAVFEGTGFISSLKRSALVGILLLAPKRHPIHVRSTVEEALLLNPAGPVEFNAKLTLAELKKRNLC